MHLRYLRVRRGGRGHRGLVSSVPLLGIHILFQEGVGAAVAAVALVVVVVVVPGAALAATAATVVV